MLILIALSTITTVVFPVRSDKFGGQYLKETDNSPGNGQESLNEPKIKFANKLDIVPVSKSLENSNNKKDLQNNIGFWTVMDHDSKSNCILLKGEINITLFFEEEESKIINLSIPKEARANGTCFTLWEDFQDITLMWDDILDSNKTTNYLTLGFTSNWTSEFTEDFAVTKDKYALNSIEIVIMNSQNSKNETLLFTVTLSDIIEFLTPKNHSYLCNPNQILDYRKVQLRVANFQVEAFRGSSLGPSELFSSFVDCSIDNEKDWKLKIIMIIVWSITICFLVALVLAFFILRRRCASSVTNESDGEYQILE